MAKQAAETGSGATAVVAVEQHFPRGQRIVDDDLAYRILPSGERLFVWLM